jgi:inhibitor of KinA sporulation pathway (predicted exonuclease)
VAGEMPEKVNNIGKGGRWVNYIVLDLEWNQCPAGKERENPELPFEIVEIGAIKLDADRQVIGEFSETVHPKVYRKLHYRTREIIQLTQEELQNARNFPQVAEDFIAWCGEDYIFCSWGPLDLLELQRNMRFYGIPNPFPMPFLYYDIQKLFSLEYEDGKSRRSLEDAVDFLHIEKEIPFHRAFDDTFYTVKIMQQMDWEQMQRFWSMDYYRLPRKREEEVHLQFDHYAKYVSRVFPSREAALEDREVLSTRCYLCNARTKKIVPWFGIGTKQYYSVSQCSEHGLLKGKIRIKKSALNQTFVVKTMKQIDEEQMNQIRFKHEKEKKRKKGAKQEKA